MALKFFKKSTDQLFIFPNENTNTTASVMSHSVKANGAIVVHRPSHRLSQKGTIRSLPIYLQDEPMENDIVVFAEEKTEEETDIGDHRLLTIDDFQSSSSSSNSSTNSSQPSSMVEEEEEEVDIVDLVHEENARLVHQLLIQRQQQDQLQKELLFAKTTIKHLERATVRYRKLLSPPSLGEDTTLSYERKIKILLDEIDAMEEQELTLQHDRCFGSSFTPRL